MNDIIKGIIGFLIPIAFLAVCTYLFSRVIKFFNSILNRPKKYIP